MMDCFHCTEVPSCLKGNDFKQVQEFKLTNCVCLVACILCEKSPWESPLCSWSKEELQGISSGMHVDPLSWVWGLKTHLTCAQISGIYHDLSNLTSLISLVTILSAARQFSYCSLGP